jgi:hypothetical protein
LDFRGANLPAQSRMLTGPHWTDCPTEDTIAACLNK